MALFPVGAAGPLAKLRFSGFEAAVKDIPYGNLFNYWFVDGPRFKWRGMNDAAWYFAERGGINADPKRVFWVNYGYKAIVVNDYVALENLLSGVAYVGSGGVPDTPLVDGQEVLNTAVARLLLEREAAIGACPIDMTFFKTTRAPLNYLNNSDHDQLKSYFFYGETPLFRRLADLKYPMSAVSQIPETITSFLKEIPAAMIQYTSVEYLMNVLAVQITMRLALSETTPPRLPDLYQYLVDRVEDGSVKCPVTGSSYSEPSSTRLDQVDALRQVRTILSAAYKKQLLTDVTLYVDLEMGADAIVEELVTQLAYIMTHHIIIPLRSVLTNIVARFYLDKAMQLQVAEDAKAAADSVPTANAALMDTPAGSHDAPTADAIWQAVADPYNSQATSARAAVVDEVLRVHPPQQLIFFRALETFYLPSSDGYYKVTKGDRLIGNLHSAQRDNATFGIPSSKHATHRPRCDEFDITRFMDKSVRLLSKLLVFGGSYPNVSETGDGNHYCPAPDFVRSVAKLFASQLSHCSYSLKTKPYWSGYRAEGLPDRPPEFESFQFTALNISVTASELVADA
ncbi:uncharacterized protein LOC135815751 isoform X1 [Sycon ciliatum]|uniref:uncharacterized protein LOC135815751 isoform X1 n=1 Tax=Sycon ciliatum TaxID=27933 RepID=UPI0020ADF837